MPFGDTEQIVNDFKAALQAVLTRMAQYDTLSAGLQANNNDLHADKAALTAVLSEANALAEQQAQQIEALQQQLAEAQRLVGSLQADKDVIGTQRARLQAEAARLEAQTARVREELGKLPEAASEAK